MVRPITQKFIWFWCDLARAKVETKRKGFAGSIVQRFQNYSVPTGNENPVEVSHAAGFLHNVVVLCYDLP